MGNSAEGARLGKAASDLAIDVRTYKGTIGGDVASGDRHIGISTGLQYMRRHVGSEEP